MNSPSPWFNNLRLLATAAISGLLLAGAPRYDGFTDLTRPFIVGLLHLFGAPASDSAEGLTVGRLTVPWTQDCSGINLLVILLSLTVWIHRHAPPDRRFWLRLAAVFPAALLANVLRVFSLLAYRHLFFPAVESPQLHYFLGFLWLVPMILCLTPNQNRSISVRSLETLHAAAILAWLSPIMAGIGGLWITTAALLLLSQCQFSTDHKSWRIALTLGWVLAGLGIGLVSLESLWLPWLLMCPLMWPFASLQRPSIWLTLAATHPFLTLMPGGKGIAAIGIAWLLWQSFSLSHPSAFSANLQLDIRLPIQGVAVLALFLPFTASSFLAGRYPPLMPPSELVISSLGAQGYELRLPDQEANIRTVWYAAQNNDRHHTVQVCLKYRGRDLDLSADDTEVFTDGHLWLREYFIQDGKLLSSYSSYAKNTLAPRSHPGAHIIFVTSQRSMSASKFNQKSHHLAAALYERLRQTPSASESSIAYQP